MAGNDANAGGTGTGQGTGSAGAGAGAGTGQGTAGAGTGAAGAGAGTGAAGTGAGAGTGTAGAAGAGAAGAGAGTAGAGASAGAAGAGGFLGGTEGNGQGQGTGQQAAGAGAAAAAEPYTLTVPEGVGEALDKPLVDWFTQTANSAKLPKDAAQALLDGFAKRQVEEGQKALAAMQQAEKDAAAALAAHPRIGGAKYQESVAAAKTAVQILDRAVEGLGSRAWQKLRDAGLGFDPDVAELLTTIGSRMKEDSTGTRPAVDPNRVRTKKEALGEEFPSLADEIKTERR